MRWIETFWFKHLCTAIACIFIAQSVQPIALGCALPQPPLVSAKLGVVQAAIPVHMLKNQVSSIIDKVNGQLQELEVLPNIENLTKRHESDAVSCDVPDGQQLASAKNLEPQHSSRRSKNRGYVRQGTGKEEGEGKTWLDLLSSLFVSEAHAQTSDPNLESTPDANTADQFIIDKAQELGNDPDAIFAFVREKMAMNPTMGHYVGREEGCGVRRGILVIKPVC